jgi:branched-chain amino acid transport system permease protein
MDALVLALCGGLLTGVTYALLALGLVLLFRATRVFNFAHGQFALLGAYLAAALQEAAPFRESDAGQVAAILISIVCVAGLSAGLYRLLLHRLTGLAPWMAVFATFGVGAFLESALAAFFSGSDVLLRLPGLPSGGVTAFGIRLSAAAVILAAISLAIYAATALLIYLTAFGRQMTAAGQNPLLASLSGISIHRSYTSAWAMAGALAAVAGIAFGGSNVVGPGIANLGMLAFPALLLGGLDSVIGALVGGLIVGVIQGMTATYLDGGAVSMVVYALLLVVLLVRPEGLLGTREVSRL